ncbi:MAG TPA: hypothetical protein V6D17_04140 [Candidatus Obscuribacterales bacterium]
MQADLKNSIFAPPGSIFIEPVANEKWLNVFPAYTVEDLFRKSDKSLHGSSKVFRDFLRATAARFLSSLLSTPYVSISRKPFNKSVKLENSKRGGQFLGLNVQLCVFR